MRKTGLFAVFIFCSGAMAAPSLESAIGACSGQPDNTARLACYDAVAAQLKSAAVPTAPALAAQPARAPAPVAQIAPVPAAPVAPAPAAVSAPAVKPPAAPTALAEFGAESLAQPAREAAGQPEPLDEIKSGVTEVYFTSWGRFIVTLANGQMWRQIDGDTGHARFKKTGGDTVTISRGFLASYNLVVDGHNGMFKVSRIK